MIATGDHLQFEVFADMGASNQGALDFIERETFGNIVLAATGGHAVIDRDNLYITSDAGATTNDRGEYYRPQPCASGHQGFHRQCWQRRDDAGVRRRV